MGGRWEGGGVVTGIGEPVRPAIGDWNETCNRRLEGDRPVLTRAAVGGRRINHIIVYGYL